MGRYYDKTGKKIGLYQWADLYENRDYARVAFDQAGAATEISTVWLGLDHRFGSEGPPLIFETAVRQHGRWDIVARYPTLEDAIVGHCAALERVKQTVRN